MRHIFEPNLVGENVAICGSTAKYSDQIRIRSGESCPACKKENARLRNLSFSADDGSVAMTFAVPCAICAHPLRFVDVAPDTNEVVWSHQDGSTTHTPFPESDLGDAMSFAAKLPANRRRILLSFVAQLARRGL